MYRYQKMLKRYLDMEEFKGYEMDYTVLKGFYFEYETRENIYFIKITDGAFYFPKINKQRKIDKQLEKIKPEEAETEVYELYKKISSIMEEANESYKAILPEYITELDNIKIETKIMVENMPNYKNYPIEFPEEIRVWSDIYYQNEFIFELETCLVNHSKMKNTPNWCVEKTNLKKIKNEENYKQIQSKIEQFIKKMKNDLNKPYRLRQMFEKEVINGD